MNAKRELIDHIGDRKVKYIQIQFERDYYNTDIFEGALDTITDKLDFEYDNGFGMQYIIGTIWYTDGTWSDRREYDGSEWWEYHTPPQIPSAAL